MNVSGGKGQLPQIVSCLLVPVSDIPSAYVERVWDWPALTVDDLGRLPMAEASLVHGMDGAARL
jgi:hypothetical protein